MAGAAHRVREQDGPAAAAAAAAPRRPAAARHREPPLAARRGAGRGARAANPAVDDAVAHAELAVTLAPDLAERHLALARARLAQARAAAAGAGGGGPACVAAARDPHTARAFLADLRRRSPRLAPRPPPSAPPPPRLRLFLHDFHHLPLLRRPPVQASFLGLVLLAVPLVFGLGPFAVLLVASLAAWLYLSPGSGWPSPWRCSAGGRPRPGRAGRPGHRLDRHPGRRRPRARARRSPTPEVAELAALGRRAAPAPRCRRWGATSGAATSPTARRLVRRGPRADPRAAEILVNIGNVLFLQDDLEGAKASYLAAGDRAGGDLTIQAAAHYNLSKLYLRLATSRSRARRATGPSRRTAPSCAALRRRRRLLRQPLPGGRAGAGGQGAGAGARRRRAAGGPGGGPRAGWPGRCRAGPGPGLPLGLVAVLWALALLAARRRPRRQPCEKCGRPACRRCDAGGGGRSAASASTST